MSKFYLEKPSINRKEEAILYVKEHIEYNFCLKNSNKKTMRFTHVIRKAVAW